MFPGQGSQYINMGKDFLDAFGGYREYFEISSSILKKDLLKVISGSDGNNLLNDTRFSQISIYTLSCAVNDCIRDNLFLKREQIDTVTGHSLGDYSALYSAGAYSFTRGAELVGYRGLIMSGANRDNKGMMAAVLGAEKEVVENTIGDFKDSVFVANYNDYGQIVISGYEDSVKEAAEKLKIKGAKIIPLKVGIASHCPLMKKVSDKLGEFIDDNIKFNDFNLPFFSSTEAAYTDKENIRNTLVRQLINPIRWVESIEYLLKKGIEIFVEVGPGKVLCRLVERIARKNNKEIISVSTDKMENIENLKKYWERKE